MAATWAGRGLVMAEALFEVQARRCGTCAEVIVHGDLDVTTAPRLAEMLTLAASWQPATLVVDLGGVDYLDCAAMHVLAQGAGTLPAGHQLTVRNPGPVAWRVLQLTGLGEIVTVEDGAPEPGRPLAVTAARDGHICLLTITGDLDMTTAGELAAQAAQTAGCRDGQAERLVLDLSGLSFLDAAGARALSGLAAAAPPGCPVIVRAVSPAAARVLGLLGLRLERLHPVAAAGPGEQLAQRARAARAQLAALAPDLRDTAARLARAEDHLAVTFARMAAEYPHRAGRLTALGAAARQAALRSHHLAGQL